MSRLYEEIARNVAKDIYDFIFNAYYSRAPKQVVFRLTQGERGIQNQILDYIWETYVEPEHLT